MEAPVIETELNRRFAQDLPEHSVRRIIFWLDEEGDFIDRVDEVRLENAELLKLSRNNLFQAKKRLAHDAPTTNFLVYQPFEFEKKEDDWFLNMKLYGEEFRADLLEFRLKELDLPLNELTRQEMKTFRQFFDSKRRREKFGKFFDRSTGFSPTGFRLAILSVLAESKASTPQAILRAVFESGLDVETNEVFQKFLQCANVAPLFKQLADKVYGYDREIDLLQLAIRVFLSGSAQTLDSKCFHGLEFYLSEKSRARCYDFVSEWANEPGALESFTEFARAVEREVDLKERLSAYRTEDLWNAPFFPCVDEIVLSRLLEQVVERAASAEIIESTLEKRRKSLWYDAWSNYYEGLSYVAKILAFEEEHGAGFHEPDAQALWWKYTTEYYRMDSWYRGFQLAFQRALKKTNGEFDDLFKQVAERVEDVYAKFLSELGERWANVAAEDFKAKGFVEVPRQALFYESCVKKSVGSKRVYVVISDALRYEVAASLAERLRRDKQSKVDLEGRCGIFPTTTPYGMAALLPSSKLTVKKTSDGTGLAVLADGLPTDATNREAVLQKERPNSVALQYKKLVALKTSEQLALVKGADVVYIYHDKIDETSHASEDGVFFACEEAIEDLCNIVRIVTNTFKGTRVLITSDHGFLYTYRAPSEDAKLPKGDWAEKAVDFGKRYAILPKGAAPQSTLPIRFLDGKTEYEAFSPRGTVRFNASGGGSKFVHGGASLQEIVVPVLEYRRVRSNSKEYADAPEKFDARPVTIALSSVTRKICNLAFALNFYQKEAVSDKRAAETYLLYFTNAGGEKVSDVVKIIADKREKEAVDRQFRCKFNLKQIAYDNKDVYYLVIVDEKGTSVPQRIEFRIDVPFAVDDFGF